jgi:hypothetical protein
MKSITPVSEEIIWKKFEEWTGGLSPQDARIKVFEHIRDIPYFLIPQQDDPYLWAASILAANKGACSPKHYLMGLLLEKMGIPVKYTTYQFRWIEQPLNYPDDLKELARHLSFSYHVVCNAGINNRFVLLDASWDIRLRTAGFPVNVSWDGLSDTLNAVVPSARIDHDTLQARLDFVREKRKSISVREKVDYAEFIEKFNSWLDNLREKRLNN